MDRLPVYHVVNTHVERHIHTQVHTCGQFRVSSGPKLRVFGLWEEPGGPSGHPGELVDSPAIYLYSVRERSDVIGFGGRGDSWYIDERRLGF